MILHWDQLELFYGPGIGIHRHHFEAAGQTTYGLLCCRVAQDNDRLAYSGGAHAEQRLLQTELWTGQLPAALAHWSDLDDPIVVVMVINRSPCRDCTTRLYHALNRLLWAFPLRCEKSRFILASLGAYEDAAMETRTTQRDLQRLNDVGWELCVLQVGPRLTTRGQLLRQGIERIGGRGIVRLGG